MRICPFMNRNEHGGLPSMLTRQTNSATHEIPQAVARRRSVMSFPDIGQLRRHLFEAHMKLQGMSVRMAFHYLALSEWRCRVSTEARKTSALHTGLLAWKA